MTDRTTQWVARKSHEKLHAKTQDDHRLIFNMLSIVGVSAPFVPLVVPSQLTGWHTPVLIVDLQ